MAGYHGNWFKSGGFGSKGQALYLSKAQQQQYVGSSLKASQRHALIQTLLDKSGPNMLQAQANTQLPVGVAKSALPVPPPPPPKKSRSRTSKTQPEDEFLRFYPSPSSMRPGARVGYGMQVVVTEDTPGAPVPKISYTETAVDGAGDYAIIRDSDQAHQIVHVPTGKIVSSHTTGPVRERLEAAQKELYTRSRQGQPSSLAAYHHAKTGRSKKRVPAQATNPDKEASLSELITNIPALADVAVSLVNKPYSARVDSTSTRGDMVLAAIQTAQGWDSKPQVVTRKALDAMLQSGKVTTTMVRGAGGYEKELMDGDFFGAGMNGRVHGAGVYTSSEGGPSLSERAQAWSYSRAYTGAQYKMARMGLRPSAKTIDTNDLERQWMDWLRKHRAEVANLPQHDPRAAVYKMMEQDKGYFAAAMGYDAITARYPYDGMTGIIVLNRSVIVGQNTLEQG